MVWESGVFVKTFTQITEQCEMNYEAIQTVTCQLSQGK